MNEMGHSETESGVDNRIENERMVALTDDDLMRVSKGLQHAILYYDQTKDDRSKEAFERVLMKIESNRQGGSQ